MAQQQASAHARMRTRDALTQLAQQRLSVLPRRPVHRQQRGVADVLQRDVDVLHDLRNGCDGVDEVVREVGRVGVQDADPLDAGDCRQRGQQLREAAPIAAWEVLAVLVGVLRNQVQLAHARRRKALCLVQHSVPRLGAKLAAEGGDGAERALVVAALRHAQVRRVARRQGVPVPLRPKRHGGGTHQHARRRRPAAGAGVASRRLRPQRSVQLGG
jgi:hypothetical protein